MSLSNWSSDPQYLAFEQAIIDNPDDDTPRLVLADWLEEHGDEHAAARAEFIRVQTELARLSPYDPQRIDLTRREKKLLAQHEKAWLGPLEKIVTDVHWQKGFVHRVKLGVRQFLDNADVLFRNAPILDIQLLRVSQTKMPMSELAACPHFSRLRGLRFPSSSIGDHKLSDLLKAANLENLEVLDLSGASPGRKTLQALATISLPRLRSLDLSQAGMLDSLSVLTSAKVSFSLQELNLAWTVISAADRSSLFRWPALANLERLDLGNVQLRQEGIRELINSPFLSSLRELNLTGVAVGVRGMEMLRSTAALANLEALFLNGANLRRKGVTALVSSPHLTRLTRLSLGGNEMGPEGVQDLAGWSALANVGELDLCSNGLTATSVQRLTTSPHLGELVSLILSDNEVKDEGAIALANCPKLASLQQLGLSYCRISGKGIKALLESPHLITLQELRLAGNTIRDETRKLLHRRFPGALYQY